MPDEITPEAFAALQAELRQLRIQVKKKSRELSIAQETIERNRITFSARQNLSEIVAAEKSRLERYMNLLLENCPDIILLFDAHGRLAYCTESYLRARRLAGDGLVKNVGYAELFLGHGAEGFVAKLAAIFQSDGVGRETTQTDEVFDFGLDGHPRHFSVQLTPMFGEDGKAQGAMVFFYDTTELLTAKHEAERASAAKSDFLATVSHEIRTPMNAIMGLSTMLHSTPLSPAQQDHLAGIEKSSQTLLALINDILDFSKIEAGKLEILPEYFSLPLLLDHIASMFTPMFTGRGLTLELVLQGDLPEVVYGDEKRILQVISNVLTNALKYTRAGGAVLRVSYGADGVCALAVTDTGVGIHESEAHRLFSAFEQLDQVKNKRITGTGLGLAITKRLCLSMGGDITVDSVYGQGSTFTIVLPLPRGTQADLPAPVLQTTAFATRDVCALVVDDIEINLQIAAFMLERFGIRSDLALSGREAIALAESTAYDIIFMDHMMPEMDGLEAVANIRALGGHNAAVPIIALTANAVSGAADMFLRHGMNGFLSKPMDEAALAGVLMRWLPGEKIIPGASLA